GRRRDAPLDSITLMAITTKARHEALGLTLEDAKGMYRAMLLTRMLGERMMQMNRMGRAAFVGVADGHEAAEVGSAWAIRRGHDWVHPYYRDVGVALRSEEHTSELQSRGHLVCRLLLEKKNS